MRRFLMDGQRHVIAAMVCVALVGCSGGNVYPLRWVYASRSLQADSHVEELREIIGTAGKHGLIGVVLSAGFDRLDLQPAEYFTRLEEVKRIAAGNGVEIVPIIFSAGYGGSALAHDNNLAAGLPVKDALFVVKGGKAALAPDPPVQITNGGFEEFADGRAAGFSRPEKWGEVISRDTAVFREGTSSLRFENFGEYPAESAQFGAGNPGGAVSLVSSELLGEDGRSRFLRAVQLEPVPA